jgi:hypothetical protein
VLKEILEGEARRERREHKRKEVPSRFAKITDLIEVFPDPIIPNNKT